MFRRSQKSRHALPVIIVTAMSLALTSCLLQTAEVAVILPNSPPPSPAPAAPPPPPHVSNIHLSSNYALSTSATPTPTGSPASSVLKLNGYNLQYIQSVQIINAQYVPNSPISGQNLSAVTPLTIISSSPNELLLSAQNSVRLITGKIYNLLISTANATTTVPFYYDFSTLPTDSLSVGTTQLVTTQGRVGINTNVPGGFLGVNDATANIPGILVESSNSSNDISAPFMALVIQNTNSSTGINGVVQYKDYLSNSQGVMGAVIRTPGTPNSSDLFLEPRPISNPKSFVVKSTGQVLIGNSDSPRAGTSTYQHAMLEVNALPMPSVTPSPSPVVAAGSTQLGAITADVNPGFYGTDMNGATSGLSSGHGLALWSTTGSTVGNVAALANFGLIIPGSTLSPGTTSDFSNGVFLSIKGWYTNLVNPDQKLPIGLGGGLQKAIPSIYITGASGASGNFQKVVISQATTWSEATTTAGSALLTVDGTINPAVTATSDLGSTSFRWNKIYTSNTVDVSSDQRLKRDIRESDLGLDFINSLRPVSYQWKADPENSTVHYGLIAQELEKTLKGKVQRIVSHDRESDTYGIAYTELIAPMIKAIQEQQDELNRKDQIIKQQQETLKNIQIRLEKIEKSLSSE